MVVEYICEVCGVKGKRHYSKDKLPKAFFCSRSCQNVWQKSREDLRIKNRDPKFRKKVSEGLKRRKIMLGEDYHSKETKQKIGIKTLQHWEQYEDNKREKILSTLRANAKNKINPNDPYNCIWRELSKEIRKKGCIRCGKQKRIVTHHIIPIKNGGTHERQNLVPLCVGCHTKVEYAQKKIYSFIQDWKIVQMLVRERLGGIKNGAKYKIRIEKLQH